MTELTSLLTNFGFPIALCIYLLARFEKILSELSKTNSELVNKNSNLITEISVLKENISELRDLLLKRGRK